MVWPASYRTCPSASGTSSRSAVRRSHSAADSAASKAFCCGRCCSAAERFFTLDLLWRILVELLDALLRIADALLHFPGNLLRQSLDLLFLAADQLAGLFLDFADGVLHPALDLILVHILPIRSRITTIRRTRPSPPLGP